MIANQVKPSVRTTKVEFSINNPISIGKGNTINEVDSNSKISKAKKGFTKNHNLAKFKKHNKAWIFFEDQKSMGYQIKVFYY